jgi:hypothetical protein
MSFDQLKDMMAAGMPRSCVSLSSFDMILITRLNFRRRRCHTMSLVKSPWPSSFAKQTIVNKFVFSFHAPATTGQWLVSSCTNFLLNYYYDDDYVVVAMLRLKVETHLTFGCPACNSRHRDKRRRVGMGFN